MISYRRGLPLALLLSICALPAASTTYRIEPAETTAAFEVRFLGLFPLRGDFRRTAGTLVFDPRTRRGSIEVSIDTTTLEASVRKAESSARSADFFHVDKFASIDFKSSRFVFDDSRLRGIEGMLTLVGVTRPVVLQVSNVQCEPAAERERAHCRAVAELVVKRSAFGMTSWSHSVSDEVTIRIAIVARQVTDEAADNGAPTAALPRLGLLAVPGGTQAANYP